MSETARALGMPGQIEWQGKTLTVSRITFAVEAHFEQWLEANRDRALERCRGRVGREVYKDRLAEANAQDGALAFAWTGPVAQQAAWSEAGFRELSFFCLKEHQPGWTRQQHEELLADAAKAAELVAVIHRITAPDPNGRAPGPLPEGEAGGKP